MMRFSVRMGLLTTLLLAPACGPATAFIAEPDTPHGRLRGCGPEAFPETLPSPAALVDLAELSKGIESIYESSSYQGGSATLTMWYEPDGSNSRRDLVRHTLPPVVADSIQKLVFSSLLTQPKREEPWGVRLIIDIEDETSYDVGRRERCPPRSRDPVLENTIQGAATMGTRSGPGARWVFVEATVHPFGYVVDARIVRGASPGGTLERRLYEFVRQYSFEPARVDGIPVTGTIEVPVRVRR